MKIVVYSTSWCPDCIRSKRLLDQMGLTYAELDVEEIEGAGEAMKRLNGGSRNVPTILVDDRVLIEPSDDELRDAIRAVRDRNLEPASAIG